MIGVRAMAEIVGLGLAAVTAVIAARTVGPAHLGNYAVAQAVFLFASTLSNGGMTTEGQQRVASDRAQPADAWATVTIARGIGAFVVGIAILAGSTVLPLSPELRAFLYSVVIALAFVPVKTDWLLVGLGRVTSMALLRVASAGAQAFAAVALLRSEGDARYLPALIIVPTIVTAVGSLLLSRRFALVPRAREQARLRIRDYFDASRHYLIGELSVFVYTSSDRLFLYALATPAIVGLYEAAYKVILPFYAISTVVGDAMYRRLAESFRGPDFAAVFRRYLDLMCVFTLPLGFFLAANSGLVVAVLYGPRFAGSAPYLAVLGFVITFGFTSGVTVIPFSAWGWPREFSRAILAGNVANLVLNVALIPTLLGRGAALATVGAKVVVTMAGLRVFRRAVAYPIVPGFAFYLGMSALGLVASLISSRLLPTQPAIAAAAFVAVYGFLVWWLRVFAQRVRDPNPPTAAAT